MGRAQRTVLARWLGGIIGRHAMRWILRATTCQVLANSVTSTRQVLANSSLRHSGDTPVATAQFAVSEDTIEDDKPVRDSINRPAFPSRFDPPRHIPRAGGPDRQQPIEFVGPDGLDFEDLGAVGPGELDGCVVSYVHALFKDRCSP